MMYFSGDYAFLSNFYRSPVSYDGRTWKTVEHAYQAAKTNIESEKEAIRNAELPNKAKRMGKSVTMRSDWDYVKVGVMEELLRLKFDIPELEALLVATGNLPIVEGNYWGDTFWGVDINTGIGKNMLGKLLMMIREEKISF